MRTCVHPNVSDPYGTNRFWLRAMQLVCVMCRINIDILSKHQSISSSGLQEMNSKQHFNRQQRKLHVASESYSFLKIFPYQGSEIPQPLAWPHAGQGSRTGLTTGAPRFLGSKPHVFYRLCEARKKPNQGHCFLMKMIMNDVLKVWKLLLPFRMPLYDEYHGKTLNEYEFRHHSFIGSSNF